MIRGCPGSIAIREARPDDMECPHCGQEMEIWSDEVVARCHHCGLYVSKERGASCIDWCKSAVDCIGLEAYERLKKVRPLED